MRRKLTINDLAPYLPYGLKFICIDPDSMEYEISFATNIHFGNEIIEVGATEFEFSDLGGEELKPILRTISDLTKEIEHNGERFVPLIKLYKLSNSTTENIDYEYIKSWGAGYILRVNHEKSEYTDFIYHNYNFRKQRHSEKGSFVFGMDLPHAISHNIEIENQYFLHELLFKWHFDIYGLIDKNLAIDLNTIEQ